MRKILLLLMIILISSSVSAESSVDFYYSRAEDLDIDAKAVFSKMDHQITPKYLNGTFIYPSTVEKRIWNGALHLARGELITPPNNAFDVPKLNGTYNVTINRLTTPSANISIIIKNSLITVDKNEQYSVITQSKFSTKILNTLATEGDTFQGNYSIKVAGVARSPSDNTLINSMSYLNLLEYEKASIFTSSFAVQMQMPGNESWGYDADISIKMTGKHNPTFFDLMVERYEAAFYDNEDSVGTETVSNNFGVSLSVTSSSTPYPLYILPTLITVLILKLIKKHKHKNERYLHLN